MPFVIASFFREFTSYSYKSSFPSFKIFAVIYKPVLQSKTPAINIPLLLFGELPQFCLLRWAI